MFADFCIIFMDSLQLSAVNLRCVRLGSALFGRRPLQFVHGYLTKFINDININLDYWRISWKSAKFDKSFIIFMPLKIILLTQQELNWNASIKSLEKLFQETPSGECLLAPSGEPSVTPSGYPLRRAFSTTSGDPFRRMNLYWLPQ